MKRHTLLSLWIALSLCLPLAAGDRITGRQFATRSEVLATGGMAATSQPLATQTAVEILRQGGSAIDAAIAANAVLGLAEPVSCGIGGDLFAILWDPKTERLHGLNASGRSPKSLTLDYFQKQGIQRIPTTGPLPVSVPGCVDGWFELHKRFGKLPMKQILAPAIRYAREGFPVTELIAYYWERSVASLGRYPGFLATFSVDGKRPPREGEIFRNPRLAGTLEKIAEAGRDTFYRGDMARHIGEYIKENGGFLSYEDMASHRSEWADPISVSYRGFDVWEMPPNTQGLAVLQMLNILEGYDFRQIPFGSFRHIHLFTEAKKLVFADRAKFYADPEFAAVPWKDLLSKEYAARRRALIDPERAGRSVEAGNPALKEGDTIYLTTADAQGMMVSLIQSNYMGMGSGMTPADLGFCLQDRGALFTLEAGQANTYAPGKRPFHTIIPAFITKDGKPYASFGVMGGDFQPLGHVQIVMNLIDFGMNLQEAGDAPRMSHDGSASPTGEASRGAGSVQLETGFPYETIRELMRRGHKVEYLLGGYGGYQAIRYDAGQKVFHGASESRKDGQAAGF